MFNEQQKERISKISDLCFSFNSVVIHYMAGYATEKEVLGKLVLLKESLNAKN